MTIRALEFYSGIGQLRICYALETVWLIFPGGLHRALQVSDVDCAVVRAFDWDQTSCRVYEANYGPGVAKKVSERSSPELC